MHRLSRGKTHLRAADLDKDALGDAPGAGAVALGIPHATLGQAIALVIAHGDGECDTIGPNPDADDVLFFISREDSDEPTSNVAIEGLIDSCLAGDDPAVAGMLEGCALQIVPMVAIDAVVIGSPYSLQMQPI